MIPDLAAWDSEPFVLRDEREYTVHADSGWLSWNGMSPERDFCEFAGKLARLLQPQVIVETGVGQGFTTRRLAPHAGELRCFESDGEWRSALGRLAFFGEPGRVLAVTPSATDFRAADLSVLDSDPPFRLNELALWRENAKPQSVLLVHDCGNDHPEWALHRANARAISEIGIPGVFLRNPRGGFLGVQV